MAVTFTPVSNRLGRRMRHPTLDVDGALNVGGASRFSGVLDALTLKQDGVQLLQGLSGRVFRGAAAPASIATAGAGSPSAANILTGTIVRDCAGASRIDTLPTAAQIVAAITTWTPAVGDCIDFLYINGSDAAETITITEGTGGGWDTNQTASSRVIPQNTSKLIRLRLTNVTASSEAYVLYA